MGNVIASTWLLVGTPNTAKGTTMYVLWDQKIVQIGLKREEILCNAKCQYTVPNAMPMLIYLGSLSCQPKQSSQWASIT